MRIILIIVPKFHKLICILLPSHFNNILKLFIVYANIGQSFIYVNVRYARFTTEMKTNNFYLFNVFFAITQLFLGNQHFKTKIFNENEIDKKIYLNPRLYSNSIDDDDGKIGTVIRVSIYTLST